MMVLVMTPGMVLVRVIIEMIMNFVILLSLHWAHLVLMMVLTWYRFCYGIGSLMV